MVASPMHPAPGLPPATVAPLPVPPPGAMPLIQSPPAVDMIGQQQEALLRDPVWWVAREECTPSCLQVLWPFVGGLLNQPKLVEAVNRERIRPLFRCISQLHERAELAETQV